MWFIGNKKRERQGVIEVKTALEVSRENFLTPFEEFEKANNIHETRDDIPYKYLGVSPSKYYRTVDMDVEKLNKTVARNLKKHFF